MVAENKQNIDFSSVLSEDFFDCLDGDLKRWAELYMSEAKEYILSFNWCNKINESYFGVVEPSCFGVFLFKIEPFYPVVDRWLWVVVGDIPPAYLVCDKSSNPDDAIRAYVYEMRRWVVAVENGLPVDGLIPVSGGATVEVAKMLGSRIDLMQEYIKK